jgi:hypothetical protein
MELATIQQYIKDVCAAAADPKDLQTLLEKFEVIIFVLLKLKYMTRLFVLGKIVRVQDGHEK